jgi:GTP pyrophosphokinase
MHRVAEEGIAAHWRYKEGKIENTEDQDKINWLRQLLEWQQELQDPREFLEAVKVDLFPDDVYVFTPRGEVRQLPRGSTPIDFAYQIHTDIGHQCSGAKVNGKLVPLKYELKNGNQVEIISSPNHKPSRDWLNIVKTSRAKTKIKAWLKAEQRKWSVALGKELTEKELKRHHVNLNNILGTKEFKETAAKFGFNMEEDLLAAIGYGKLSILQAFKAYLPEDATPVKKKPSPTSKPSDGVGIKVGGLEDENIMIRIAKCCSPVPGDPIIGFITRGRGLSVHAVNCPSVHMLEYDSERMISVDWDEEEPHTYAVEIHVITWDRAGLLAKISSAIASREVNIMKAKVETRDDKKAYLHFSIGISDLSHLQEVMNSISKIDGVLKVRRGP